MSALAERNRQLLENAAVALERELPERYGFILLAFPFDGQGDNRMVYLSNARREDAIAALKEWLLKAGAAEDWMRHIK